MRWNHVGSMQRGPDHCDLQAFRSPHIFHTPRTRIRLNANKIVFSGLAIRPIWYGRNRSL